MSRTKSNHISYRDIFLYSDHSSDKFDIDIIDKIEDDYNKFHEHEFSKFIDLLSTNKNTCPKCKSTNIIGHGYDRNGTARFKCKTCNSTFNQAKNSLLFSSKINIKAWYAFLECVLSGTSIQSACRVAKISKVTGYNWMKKIFKSLEKYQENIRIYGNIFIDETYIHVDKSKTIYKKEIGKTKKVLKEPRGISINKICILLATNKVESFAEIVNKGRPTRIRNYEICKKHIVPKSLLIGDEDYSLTYAAKELNLKRILYKSNTELAYKKLKPVDQLCNRLKFFLNKHRGFKKDVLQDYINLFIFVDNHRKTKPLYETTQKLLKLIFSFRY